jgi:glycosyltransferase involved in cell wall biosynthesis
MRALACGRIMSRLVVVVPAFNESAGLRALHARLAAVLDALDLDGSVLYVDDGSSDDTWAVIDALAADDARVAGLRLSRNFGKELALTAGLDHADAGGRADAVVVIDADLQDPPELIPTFVEHWRAGGDVIYGVRASRAGESAFKKWTSMMFYRVMGRLSHTPVPRDTGDFRLLSRRVLDALGEVRERERFMKGLFAWVGFRQVAVSYARDPRHAGASKWNYWRLWNFAIDGITSFSSAPLKAATYLGLLVALGAFAFGVWVLLKALLFGDPVRGYPSLMVVVLFLGGVQLLALGVLGEYVGRLHIESKQRPLYLVDRYRPPREAHGDSATSDSGIRESCAS